MLDLYCERAGSGLLAEPLNLLTNAAFPLAALASWRLVRDRRDATLIALVLLMASVGLGSSLFHAFATPWAWFVDVAPILAFQLWFLWLYLHRVDKRRPPAAATALAAFLLAVAVTWRYDAVLNGSLIYAPALVVLSTLGAHHFAARRREHVALLAAAGIFTVSLVFRTVDNAVCDAVPVGTHFLWHLLTPAAMHHAFRGLAANLPPGGTPDDANRPGAEGR